MFDEGVQAEALILDDEGPAICPECGAPVDKSTVSMAENPTCEYCAKPLPCEPARSR
jgi:hypothetical protein